MNIEEFFEATGLGKFQKLHYSLLSLSGLLCALSTMCYVFVAAVPDYWCASPVMFMNLTVHDRKALTIPFDGLKEYSKCTMFDWSGINDVNSRNASVTEYNTFLFVRNRTVDDTLRYSVNVSSLPVKNCSSWEYDRSQYDNTVVMEWDLVCGKEWIIASIGAGMGIGKLVCSFVVGVLSDRFGRKRTLVGFLVMQCLCGVLSAVSVNPIMFIISFACLGGTATGIYAAAFVLGLEIVGVKYRGMAGLGVYLAWSVGYLLVVLVAYFIRNWVTLQLSLHLPMLILVVLYAWLTPESPRWLLQHHRVEDAIAVLKRIAWMNNVEWNTQMEQMVVTCKQADEQISNISLLISLVKSRTMALYTVVNAMLWFCANLLFFGLSYNTSNLVGDPYANFAISGAVEIPALLCTYFMLKSRLRRRGTTFFMVTASAAFLLVTALIPEEFGWLVTTLAMLGKFTSTSLFATIFLYTPEMYPTAFRSVAIGTASTVGRVGVIVAPYIAITGKVYFRELPLIIFGFVSLAVAGVTFLLPETGSTSLPDTLDDFKNLKNHRISCSRKRRRASCNSEELKTFEPEKETLTTEVLS